MKKIIFTVFLCCYIFPALSQKIEINSDWCFQRLSNELSTAHIANQGTSWESQFNISHVESNPELRIPSDTLKVEFEKLKQGEWQKITLPHTPNLEELVVKHQWQGIGYYKKELDYDASWVGKNIWLEFEGAMQLADVWVNGKHVLQHAGGYTPFVIDLTNLLFKDKPNEILVRLDNRDNPLIPPGKPLSTLDFCYYGGIYRNVNLIVKSDEVYISHPILADQVAGGGVFVTYPVVTEKLAQVHVKTHLVNAANHAKTVTLNQKLYDLKGLYGKYSRGKLVAKNEVNVALASSNSKHQIQLLDVNNPRLWCTDKPYLYLLISEVVENGIVVDKQETKIGIRHIHFSKQEGFLLNGKPIRLVGSNRHMEYPYVGNALPDRAQRRDIYQIKDSGFNVVRLGHYPQAEVVLDACDELGLLAIEPIPGWQFFNQAPLFTALTYRDVKEMIRRDRNHPSVIMWETTLNESWPPTSWKDGAVATAHAEYPGNQCYTSGDGYGYDGFDVVYNDWKEGFIRPNPGTKAGFIREYYDYEFGGHYSSTRVGRADGEKALVQNAWNAQWSHNRYREQYPWTAGDAVWSMYDYNRGCCDNICESGVADLFRLPKFSLHFYKSQISVGTPLPTGEMKPFVYLATHWTKRNLNCDTVLVYGNVDEVELRLNGVPIARQHADQGVNTEYTLSPDGGNCRNLAHAPFTFKGVQWQDGVLEAFGYIKGRKKVSDKRITPQKASNLEISYFESGYKASKNDLLLVYIRILDDQGTLCTDNTDLVRLFVDQDHVIQGPQSTAAVAGIATFVVRTGCANSINMKASSLLGKSKKKIKLVE